MWRIYRGRANAKNRIKELKYDFGFDRFNLNGFYATEAALTFAMIAYNLMALFRTFILQEKTQKTLATLRYRTFAIGAYFEKVNDKLVLKIALNKKKELAFLDYGTAPKPSITVCFKSYRVIYVYKRIQIVIYPTIIQPLHNLFI